MPIYLLTIILSIISRRLPRPPHRPGTPQRSAGRWGRKILPWPGPGLLGATGNVILSSHDMMISSYNTMHCIIGGYHHIM